MHPGNSAQTIGTNGQESSKPVKRDNYAVMNLGTFLIHSIDWPSIPKEAFAGEEGYATLQAFRVGDIRIRMVEYSPGYKADHWCKKGHVMLCMEGELEIELEGGKSYLVRKNMTIVLGEGEMHRTYSVPGCRLFIVD